jgi:hypothetical protein
MGKTRKELGGIMRRRGPCVTGRVNSEWNTFKQLCASPNLR